MKKALKIIVYIVLLFMTLVMQTSLTGYISIGGIKPDFILIFTICCACVGCRFGVITGAITGFFADMIAVNTPSGLYMIACVLISMLICILMEAVRLSSRRYLWLVLWTLIASMVFGFAEHIFMSESLAELVHFVKNAVIARAVYNSLIMLPILLIITVVLMNAERKKRQSAKLY